MDKQLLQQSEIENRIFTIRGMQVMLDRDLAELYGVQTKRLNEQVKRNFERFPDSFRFQLSTDECLELVANCDRLQNLKHTTSNPFVFTEQGVAMLSGVLNSEVAIKVSIRIIQTFVELRKTLFSNKGLLHRMDRFEIQLADHGKKFQQIFNALENRSSHPEQGIFFDGQLFDAYTFVSDLIRSAKTDIINYYEHPTNPLTLFRP
jgi:hypothetical protein